MVQWHLNVKVITLLNQTLSEKRQLDSLFFFFKGIFNHSEHDTKKWKTEKLIFLTHTTVAVKHHVVFCSAHVDLFCVIAL